MGVYDSAAEEEREICADPEKEEETVFVLELLKLWDGLAEWLGVFVCVDDLLGDDETLEDLVPVVLPLSDTETVDVLELVWLSVAAPVSEGNEDEDTDTLGDSEEEGRLVLDTRAVGEMLSVGDAVASLEKDATFVRLGLAEMLLLAVVDFDATPLNVFVTVTVSVTPVGKVVILGVPVFARDTVTECEFVPVEQWDTGGEGLDD